MHKSYIAVNIRDSQCMRRDLKNISRCIQIVFFWTAGTFFSGKRPKTIYRSLSYLNWKHKNGFSHEEIFKVANSRLGWYKRSGMNVVNFIISKDLLENRIKDGAGLLNPLSYYLVKVGI